ncbi:ATP-binding protein [Desmospora activa]|uniref:Uncharacterized protein n=1 Tax=Desmospora activa DSM 45169 TaxID=1121389 RepID=A0A2T4YZQ8_9BACL|nr:ATP-binding protein [Desmospora activa]PTM52720.1 hypothetical protein C8J48_3713 [Desmospora activa DSM 45169]
MLDEILKNLFKSDNKGDAEMAQLGQFVIYGIPIAGLVWIFLFPQKAATVWGQLWGRVAGPATTVGEGVLNVIIALLMIAGVAAIGFIGLRVYHYRRAGKEVRYYRIVPHRKTTASAEKVDAFTKDLHKRHRVWYKRITRGREWYRWLIHCHPETREIQFYIGYPQDKENGVKKCFQDHFPNAERFPVPHDQLPLPKTTQGTGGYFRLNTEDDRAGLPLQPLNPKLLNSVLTHLEPGTWVDLRYSAEKSKRPLKKRVKQGLKSLGLSEEELISIFRLETNHPKKNQSDLDPTERAQYKSLFEQHNGREKGFEVALYLLVQPPEDPEDIMSEAIYEDVKSQVESTMEFDNFIYARRLRSVFKKLNPVRQINPMPLPIFPRMLLTHSEVGNLVHIPKGPTKEQEERDENHVFDSITHVGKGQKMPAQGEYQQGIGIAYVDHPINRDRIIRIGQNIIRKMGSVVGDIGSGKSALLIMMMQSLLEEWYQNPYKGGFSGMDPKGTLVQTMKTRILKDEKAGKTVHRDRLHIIDIASSEFALGLNLLHRHPWQTVEDVIDDTLAVLRNAYAGKTDPVLLDKYGRLALEALLLDSKQKHTILGVSEFLDKDSPLRDRLVKQFAASNDTTKKALAKEISREKFGGKDTEVVRNRLVRLNKNPIARRMFGQFENNLNILEWLDEGHVVLFNCQHLPPEIMRLTMGYIANQYWQMAQHRKYKQRNHPLFIDEAHMVQLPVLSEMLEVLRDFGLPLYLCTQHYGQYEDSLLSDALGLVGTKIAFKQEDEGHADKACKKAGRSFEPRDIQNLKSFQAALYVENSKGEKQPLLVRTDPPYVFGEDGEPTYFGEDVERIDREKNKAFAWADQELARPLQKRDCTPISEVNQQINDYLESLWGEKEPKTGKTIGQFDIPKPEEDSKPESKAPTTFSLPKGE